MSNINTLVKEDWENREFVEVISHGLTQLTSFLTDIGIYNTEKTTY